MASPFDLRRFAPPAETTFTLSRGGDHVYAVAGDVEIDVVARMLRIENVVRGIDEGDSIEALLEGKALLLSLIQERQPDVKDVEVGPQELIVLFALFVKGPTVAEAVMESITAANAAEDEEGEEADERIHLPEDVEGEGGADVAPLPSRRRSSKRSSSSASPSSSADTAGLPATGTG